MKAHELLGLDVGKARTGIARANSVAGLAEPLTTVKTDDLLKKIDQLTTENKVDTIVIGLPRNLNGDDTAQTRWVRDWVARAKERLTMPLYWQDEALTTHQADNHKMAGNRQDTDALAAAMILQDWLDAPEAERAAC